MNRRSFLSTLLFAPAIIRTPGLLMPVRPSPIVSPTSLISPYAGMAVGDVIAFDIPTVGIRGKWTIAAISDEGGVLSRVGRLIA